MDKASVKHDSGEQRDALALWLDQYVEWWHVALFMAVVGVVQFFRFSPFLPGELSVFLTSVGVSLVAVPAAWHLVERAYFSASQIERRLPRGMAKFAVLIVAGELGLLIVQAVQR